MSDEEMEDYGFDYSDEEQDEENVDIENQYYNSKGQVENSELDEALSGFKHVLNMEKEQGEESGEWSFKALKQIVKIYYQQKQFEEMLNYYRQILQYSKQGTVSKSAFEKKINSLSDFLSTSQDKEFLFQVYSISLEHLSMQTNERLWFKFNLKLCHIYYFKKDFSKLSRLLKELRKSCQNEAGEEDIRKGTQLLEIYAIEIQMYTQQKDTKKLKELHQKALTVRSAIPHPRIMGVIYECGGKMHMLDQQWDGAKVAFFEAFKSYDEAGSPRRIACLRYMVLAHMLVESKVDPFNAQETKPFKNDNNVIAMTQMVEAYQSNDIKTFEITMKKYKQSVVEDDFIKDYIEILMRKIRAQVVLSLIKPYTSIKLPYIAKKLIISEQDVEQLLVYLILDEKIDGYIDQVSNLLIIRDSQDKGDSRLESLDKWMTQMNSTLANISKKFS